LIAADAIALELDEPACAASDLAPGVAALPGKALRVERCSATIGAVLILAKAGMVDHPSVAGQQPLRRRLGRAVRGTLQGNRSPSCRATFQSWLSNYREKWLTVV